MNIQNHVTVPSASALDEMPYRAAIDRVAMLRPVAVRIALTLSELGAANSDGGRAKLMEALDADVQALRHTADVITGKATFSDMPEVLSKWLAHAVENEDREMKVVARMVDLTQTIALAARSDKGVSAESLQSYIAFGKADFFDAITALADHIWVKIEYGRKSQLEVAMKSASRLAEGLTRLERIGKYVRSMSINASVEASRAGDSGKGLAIIAQEFKALAEEVQQLTLSAREDIESIETSQ